MELFHDLSQFLFMKAIRDLHNMDQNSQATKHLDRFLRRAGGKAKGQIVQVSGSRKKQRRQTIALGTNAETKAVPGEVL